MEQPRILIVDDNEDNRELLSRLLLRRNYVLAEAEDPEAKRAELVEDYKKRFASPYVAASRGFLDDIIEPKETRRRLIDTLRTLRGKRVTPPSRKHGNIPL